jgi:hypothetical protein
MKGIFKRIQYEGLREIHGFFWEPFTLFSFNGEIEAKMREILQSKTVTSIFLNNGVEILGNYSRAILKTGGLQ